MTRPADRLRYTFADGRRGEVGAAESPLRCDRDQLVGAGDRSAPWVRVALNLTETQFTSHGQSLHGVLIEPPGATAASPLVVLVHGSERTSPTTGSYPYILAALGLRVFAYDKRGTGQSEGEYTQNFELLADDAAAAFAEARRLAAGRFTEIGYFGGSQGGWVAPLAATRSDPQFVAVGFGLMASPIEEDRDQVLTELRGQGASAQVLAAAREVTDATATLVRSHFTEGFDALAAVKARYGDSSWFRSIRGEYTGGILASSEADLRRIGRARFDNLELIWDYDAMAALPRVRARQLWILAEEDREAPPSVTLERLSRVRRDGADLEIYSFPGTDHGMVEYTRAPDGSRSYGRITDGYFRLLADWIAGRISGRYGRARQR
ncbi:alpha/beta hydrolase [Sphingosinicella sp. LHD-64]|uniref:alpha/beta hydrolase family protein n=1 Tax=Sphingosinicella sp. LHD-64 TaxID=3072139 RepID=UPI00280CC807|nr:alpha/beta hydrolase [Sphingosinicella sp. LHD-64]MDQ8756195.1 alpha/beta hydrolase [Sphingosinicella sp. LHD-64]